MFRALTRTAFLSLSVTPAFANPDLICKLVEDTRGIPRNMISVITNGESPNEASFRGLAITLEEQERNFGDGVVLTDEAKLFSVCNTKEKTGFLDGGYDVGEGWVSTVCYLNGAKQADPDRLGSTRQKLESLRFTYYRRNSSTGEQEKWRISENWVWLSFTDNQLNGVESSGNSSGAYVCY